ncbi:MAG TPA: lipid II flippase MurJ [Candidatus Paceibacterota bacterium]
MVKQVFALLGREVRGLHEAAYLLAGFTLLSQIVALARDRMLAGLIGPSLQLDAYYAAFRLPDLVFVLVASLVSSAAVLPAIVARLERSEDAKRFASGVFTAFLAAAVVVAGIAFIWAPELAAWLAPGIASGPLGEEMALLSRVMLLSPILLGVSQIWGSVAQARGKVALYALSPILYNAGIVIGVAALYPYLGILGVAIGVVVGAALHAAILLPGISRRGGGPLPWLTLRAPWKEVFGTLALSAPRSVALAAGQIATIGLVAIASRMTTGSISVFQLAANLGAVPLALIGAAYSTAAFPILAKHFADGRLDEFARSLASATRQIVFWSLPIIALVVVLRAQLVRVVLGAGGFTWDDTRLIAACLAAGIVSLVAQNLTLLYARAHYARGATWKPFFSAALGAVVTVGSAIWLSAAASPALLADIAAIFRLHGVLGAEVVLLAIAWTFGETVRAATLRFGLGRLPHSESAARTVLEGLAASLAAALVSYLALDALDSVVGLTTTLGVFLQGLGAGLAGLAAWAGTLAAFGNREFAVAVAELRRRAWREPVVASDTTPDQVPEA